MTHWALKYIGKPWICGKYDCWGLVQDVYLNELGIRLSPIITNAADLRQVFAEFAQEANYSDFCQIKTLKDNAVVVLSQENILHMSEFGLILTVAEFCITNAMSGLFFKKRQN